VSNHGAECLCSRCSPLRSIYVAEAEQDRLASRLLKAVALDAASALEREIEQDCQPDERDLMREDWL
jgi:hypothetical protein